MAVVDRRGAHVVIPALFACGQDFGRLNDIFRSLVRPGIAGIGDHGGDLGIGQLFPGRHLGADDAVGNRVKEVLAAEFIERVGGREVAWLGKNEWFEKDKVMRSAARAIHETLVAEEGYDPTSDEYYAEIDKRMRREMPHKFQGDKKNVQSVTPAGSGNRSLKSGRKKQVELNPGQVRLAERLGVPLDKYAAQVAKLENRRD